MKIKKELISIIVPVYNVEKYIDRCMKSIFSQSYQNIEIILINDGSTDNSGSLCDTYLNNNSKIKVIHKTNGGVSSARNVGLELAEGEYIGFVDPDDWIEPTMYESMYNNIKKNDSDICICNYIIDNSENSRQIESPFNLKVLNKKEILKYIISPLISPENLDNTIEKFHGGVWRMLIKNDLIRRHKVQFQLELMEDNIFDLQLYFNCNRVSVDRSFHYHYCIYPNTLSTKYREERFGLLKKIHHVIEKIIHDNNMYEHFEPRLTTQYIKFAIMSVVNELHPNNHKNRKNKIETIKLICSDNKLKKSIQKTNSKELSIRKKIVLKAFENNYSAFLFYYYYLASHLYNLKKNFNFKKI